ncbi:hypothetical protein GobsT_60010 [Gemmata obscuriglobus]|uniref:Ice-binding protein C-terminal domain-containing protein n=1 Tax=Gemmata obscuriglobus TaxID=114 RepID=A0A2Z3H5B4_9BACT|nr:PEP-CTERM sorting domain-containing protein [Gemmata obscuriglobus]AWM36220.1 hypothetical protein C1280_03805 [Gemmata obscuriglobus]QEG31180.1 hypothetical protein GobsT_60010 [Gemmata obscuriglobus]VTS10518.1 unnamed protein product [Gemmata obscuriglobus UQM 2246]
MTTRRTRLKKGLKKLVPVMTVTFTAAPFAVWVQPAHAFFPPVITSPPPVVVVPPTLPPPVIVDPPVSPPPFVPPPPPPVVVPPVVPPVVVPPVCPPPPPCGVPEPATVVSGLIGLAAAAGYGLRRNGEKK